MKLKTLGATMIALLAGSALVFAIAFALATSQFRTALQAMDTSYSALVQPLQRIDANLTNMRFHLYAAFMHNEQLPVARLHDHPIVMHFETIEQLLGANQALWTQAQATARQVPEVDLRDLRAQYDAFIAQGIGPSLRAARAADWVEVVHPITVTLPAYLALRRTLDGKVDA